MFLHDNLPIIINLPMEQEYADIYFIHDVHYGSELFDEKKWKATKELIIKNDRALVCWIGDLLENAVPNSKSDMFTQSEPPALQKEWVASELKDLSSKTIAVVAGNHCNNRTTKLTGLYPLYDCCLYAGIDKLYRDTYAIIDIGIGTKQNTQNKQIHYFGQIQHRSKDIKSVSSCDYTDGIDFFAYGHDHEPKERPRAKLVYDPHNKVLYKRNVENINCGSFCQYGGYGAKSGYRPQSDKMYSLRIFGERKRMMTTGFYV